jgi:hypothetical protein
MSASLLRTLANRLRGDPQYFAHILHWYTSTERITEAQLAERLGVIPEMLPRLELCKIPSAGEGFAERLRVVSDYSLVDEYELANILRRYAALGAFRLVPQNAQLPAAARDREPTNGGESNE